MLETSPSSAGGAGSIPGQGANIPHASWPKNQNIKQKPYCNKFNKDFQNGPRQKKKNLKTKTKTKFYNCLSIFNIIHGWIPDSTAWLRERGKRAGGIGKDGSLVGLRGGGSWRRRRPPTASILSSALSAQQPELWPVVPC